MRDSNWKANFDHTVGGDIDIDEELGYVSYKETNIFYRLVAFVIDKVTSLGKLIKKQG